MSATVPGENVTLFKSGSAYYFNGERRKRKGVLVTALALIVLTLIFAGGLAFFNLEAWQKSIALATNGVPGTATYTRTDVDVTYTGSDSHRTYYFKFAFTADGQRHEGRHQVDLVTHERGIPAGQELAIVYDPNDPENVQARDAPPPPPLLQTGGILLLVVGCIAATVYTMKDYNRAYDPLKDGRIAQAVITEIVPGEHMIEVCFRYTSPLNKQQATGTDTLSTAEAIGAAVGLNVAVLVRGTQKATLL